MRLPSPPGPARWLPRHWLSRGAASLGSAALCGLLCLAACSTTPGGFRDDPLPDDDDDDATNHDDTRDYALNGFFLDLWVGAPDSDELDGISISESGVVRSWYGSLPPDPPGEYRGTLSQSQMQAIVTAFDAAEFWSLQGASGAPPVVCGTTLAVGSLANSAEFATGQVPDSLQAGYAAVNSAVERFGVAFVCR